MGREYFLLILFVFNFLGCGDRPLGNENNKEVMIKKKRLKSQGSEKQIMTVQEGEKNSINKEKAVDNQTKLKIEDIERQTILDAWTDKGSFWLLRFTPNKVIYEFNPSCAYWFPSKIINNEIVFYWEDNKNCSFERGLSKKFASIKNPELGKPFGGVKLVNDSTIVVHYYYKDWIKKINKQESRTIDTLFPSSFRKITFKKTLSN